MNTVKRFVAGKLAYVDSTIGGFGALFLSRLSYKTSGIVFLFLLFVFYESVFPKLGFAVSSSFQDINLAAPIQPSTESLFSEKISATTKKLKFHKKLVVDPNLKPGETKLIQAGSNGEKTTQTKVIYHQGQEFSREQKVVTEKTAVEEIIAVGIDLDEKTLQTPYGLIKYKTKLTVWATAYDPSCAGCNLVTSIGLKAGYGVIAVDPKVIPLRSKVYVPGYGIAVAGDTGGSIRGNKIDLGFDSLVNNPWTSRFTDIYLISS